MSVSSVSQYRKKAGLAPQLTGRAGRYDEVIRFIKEHPEIKPDNLSETLGLSRNTISRYRKRAGLTPLQKGPVGRYDEFVGFIKDHPTMPVLELSKILEISVSSVSQYRKKAGIAPQRQHKERTIKKLTRFEEAIEFNKKHPNKFGMRQGL